MKNKNYQELLKERIYIGGADDVEEMLENEKVDVVYDLRAESLDSDSQYNRVHCPIVDDAENQDEAIKKSVDNIVKSYHEGKNVYVHCQGGSNRTGSVAVGTLLALGKAKTIEEAEKMAKDARPKINIKPEMKEALKRVYKD
ncbi:protein-tyrosine phosphatase family protein [Evansella cellulosilytica]|uniref:Dual specificity protein phosphatase n=1 Tax=Evansella cellulosilytica (strain ATCC 21833 / DSM 2522 / FERM P-1141 / JCM 9156 / N-4) TaxID=649639 RepID=E6TVK1_EVAC2|nr:dual specificity protein phosphatase family protein [Evansella cellulosilytica]ADU31018.1 dual specificity protein phosphatase [Evansella cellulosilytica DSM 2522]